MVCLASLHLSLLCALKFPCSLLCSSLAWMQCSSWSPALLYLALLSSGAPKGHSEDWALSWPSSDFGHCFLYRLGVPAQRGTTRIADVCRTPGSPISKLRVWPGESDRPSWNCGTTKVGANTYYPCNCCKNICTTLYSSNKSRSPSLQALEKPIDKYLS